MNMKRNLIETASATLPNRQVACMAGGVELATPIQAVLPRHSALGPRTQVGIGRRPAGDQTGEFWEALSQAVLWICGLAGIVLSFR
jgi:hypothetical protein